jgi:sucrose-6-phosphate hydrolase SacC (GH32 family)
MEDMKGVSGNRHGVMTVNGVDFGSDLVAEYLTFDQHQSKRISYGWAQLGCQDLLAHHIITL